MYYVLCVLTGFLCVALAIALTAVCLKLACVKKSAREIREEMDFILEGDTNSRITLSSGDKDMRELAENLNRQIIEMRKKQLAYANGDSEVKNAMTNIAHDLRTPLTAICGYLDLINEEKDENKIRDYLSIIRERTLSLKNLTEELFKYSVSLDTNHSVYLQKICLNSILKESLFDQYEQFKAKDIIPEIDMPEKNVYCLADKKDLARVFQNIIANAIKYGDGDLKVKLAEDGAITFSNTASGLTTLDVEKLFDRFYTVKNCNMSTGLGLSIAKTLVEQSGGKISASLKDNVFRLTLRLNAVN